MEKKWKKNLDFFLLGYIFTIISYYSSEFVQSDKFNNLDDFICDLTNLLSCREILFDWVLL